MERAREDRRVKGGSPSKLPGLLVGKGRVSRAKRDMHMFWAWDMADANDGRLEHGPRTLTAGVDAVQDCGVNCGVGRSPSLCKAGRVGFEDSIREVDSKLGLDRGQIGDFCSLEEHIEAMLLTRDSERRGEGASASRSSPNRSGGLEGSMSTVTKSEVNLGINVFQQSSVLGEEPGVGVYLRTMSVHRW